MKYVLVLFLGTVLFFSCKYLGGKRVYGNGNLITQDRSTGSFDGVESFGSFDVFITSSTEPSVKIEAEENLQSLILAHVIDNKLQIISKNGYSLKPGKDIKIYISGPSFGSISTNGSGNITSRNALHSSNAVSVNVSGSGSIEVELNAPKVSAEIAGSGSIKLSGSAKEFKSAIYGSGDIRARDMETEKASVEIAGSGNVEVFANTSLDVQVMGSGDVRHKGEAKVNTHIAGSGSVSRMN